MTASPTTPEHTMPMNATLAETDERPVPQQPSWDDVDAIRGVREQIRAAAPLAAPSDIRHLRETVALVARGGASVVQCGDCAEDTADCTSGAVARKAALAEMLAGTLKSVTRRPVVRVARIGGQFAKPRSRPVEIVDGVPMPAYRGHLVNRAPADERSRRPDPAHVLAGYRAAHAVFGHLGWHDTSGRPRIDPPVWTSHDALLMDYELPQIRRDGTGELYLTSTHWPWVGVRTSDPDGAHVAMLATVANPVACKVGADATAEQVLRLCERLDPDRDPGRLTLIVRMGAVAVAERLPGIVRAVRRAGHPVVWMSDPLHGNTVTTASGFKTRYVADAAREVEAFVGAVRSAGAAPGGLHLESTPDSVVECVRDETEDHRVGPRYASLCDPRLNPAQAAELVAAWPHRT